MQTQPEVPSGMPESLRRKHEAQNPSIGRIWFVGGLVILMMVVCMGLVWAIIGNWAQNRPLDQTVRARGTITAPSLGLFQRFPGPNLQVNPHDDLVALQAQEATELNTYGWIDRQSGIVRLPIARAIDLILQQGLPVRATNAPPRTGKSSLELIRERSRNR